jgi:RimJ/RimL family protein N-acetyltransferase
VSREAPRVELVARVATAADAAALRKFECSPRKPRYGGTAQQLIHKCGSVLAGNKRRPTGFECLLFEDTATTGVEGLVGVSAIQTANGVCDWIVMGIAHGYQGGRTTDGRSFAAATADETARYARRQGYKRMVAMAHRDHEKSLHILHRLGFSVVAAINPEYSLFGVDLVVEDQS